ncbi:hypothetical protein [uncultured Mucilaginibacter sp.]|uniref:hypothetical protein n=1 Tax=uncultured Mucilaginibacter sp. TaxID=797541 RepID=UPI0025FF3387|nr:hypothetical protein [uncultured Mucilaginibacter sp.]
MVKLLISSTAFTGEIEMRYNTLGALVFYDNRAQMEIDQYNFLFGRFPFTKEELLKLVQGSKTLTCVKIAVQVAFKDFWEAYNYKVGNKARAEKLWNALTETEHHLIMEHIKAYDAYLATRPRMEKLYAETYLNQRRWESEFPKN